MSSHILIESLFSDLFHRKTFPIMMTKMMTDHSYFSVGYGDKVTKTIFGRIFSVLWILMGITIFSMLTASVTDIITNRSQTSTSMLGKEVSYLFAPERHLTIRIYCAVLAIPAMLRCLLH